MNPPESCDALFISERRKPLSRVTVWLLINQAAQAAGLEHLEIHPHMLRHSCGYALVNKGTDIRIIQGPGAQVWAQVYLVDGPLHESGSQTVCETVLISFKNKGFSTRLCKRARATQRNCRLRY